MALFDQPVISSVLVGRVKEIARLERALDSARSGTGRCCLQAKQAWGLDVPTNLGAGRSRP